MQFDSDVALLGTGVAPLVAAAHLLAQGKSVLILNPDYDFFLENSELPLDPMLDLPDIFANDPENAAKRVSARLGKTHPERALEELRPDFPGAVEYWTGNSEPGTGYRDPLAPHVRQRARIWVTDPSEASLDFVENLYLVAADGDHKPQVLEGIQALSRFPGYAGTFPQNGPQNGTRATVVPRTSDVDVSRYRNGILEFVRERVGPDRIIRNATQIEPMPGGVRFRVQGSEQSSRTCRLSGGMLVFWTPKLYSWVHSKAQALAREKASTVSLPLGVRLWEEWSVISRDSLDPSTVGSFGKMVAWAEIEGAPSAHDHLNRLSVLRSMTRTDTKTGADADSFRDLGILCREFLNWNRYSIRSMRPRALFEWKDDSVWELSNDPEIRVVNGCDGPLVNVISRARAACQRYLQ